VAKAPPDGTPADRLNGLLLAIGAINYRTIVGAWCYDPRDGEVMFKVAIPVHGNALEYEDFEHCMRVIGGAVEVEGPKFMAILDGTKTGHEVVQAEGLPVGAAPPL
jgi:hypothetical protein